MFSYTGLKVKMAERDLQWQDIHNETGIAWGTISKINKGESITLTSLGRIAEYFNCDIGDLVSIKKDSTQK